METQVETQIEPQNVVQPSVPLPRITIEVNDELKHRIKVKAAQENTTLTDLVKKLLLQWLENDKSGS